MRYDIIRAKITPKNIGKFWIKDDRLKHPVFIKDRKYLEKELVSFQTGNNTDLEYPDRYDLTVLTYNQFEKEWLIIDGSHRIEGLKRIFKRKELKSFDAILLPSNILGADTKEARVAFSRRLDTLLQEEGLPLWIKKYDFAFTPESISSILGMSQDARNFVAWSNKNLIDSGGKNTIKLTLDEYQELRQL